MELQYQLSNGNWVDCLYAAQTERFLERCVEFDSTVSTRDEAIAALGAGRVLRNDREDWYSNCRCYQAALKLHRARLEKRKRQFEQNFGRPRMVTCDCGHKIPHHLVMNTTRGTSCPDCYDQMSD